jgi:hypothetical protein
VDTFLTTLYVMVDDFCHSYPPKTNPGPEASLSESEVVSLAIFARWNRFTSERDFYRYAEANLRDAFPTLPDRSQFNRLACSHIELIEAVAVHLVALLEARRCPYEVLDSSAMPVRDAKRRGSGWLAGQADIGWSNSSLGWYEGFCLLTSVNPQGVITGFGFAPASTKDQPLAETFFALRSEANPRPGSVGSAALGPYVADKGFEGEENHRRWLDLYGACVVCPPKRNGRKRRWPKRLLDVGRPPSARSLSPSTKSCTTLSVFAESVPTTWQDCGLVWRRELRCITSASGSTNNSAVLGWLSPTCWAGDLKPHQAFKSLRQ